MKKITKKFKKTVKSYKKLKPSQTRKPGEVRKKQRPIYRSFRLYKHIKPQNFVKLPSSWRVFKDSLIIIKNNKKIILFFIIIYSLLYSFFIKGFNSNLSIGEVKETFEQVGLSTRDLFTAAALFISLISSSNSSTDEVAIVYQTILFVVGSLALIWLLRQFNAKEKQDIKFKDAFYKGMGQLIPFVITFVFILLELLPMVIGFAIISFISGENVGYMLSEMVALLIFCASLIFLSLYLISGSIASIYIVTLPGSLPIKSIIVSNNLLALHRWSVVRKLIMIVVYVLILNALITIPLIMFLPARFSFIAEYMFMVFSIINITIVHNFLYTMYKKLL